VIYLTKDTSSLYVEYNSKMIAYDVPLSALLFIMWAGIPVEEYIKGPTEEETLAYIEMIRKIIADE
jgi:hypothetical protein